MTTTTGPDQTSTTVALPAEIRLAGHTLRRGTNHWRSRGAPVQFYSTDLDDTRVRWEYRLNVGRGYSAWGAYTCEDPYLYLKVLRGDTFDTYEDALFDVYRRLNIRMLAFANIVVADIAGGIIPGPVELPELLL